MSEDQGVDLAELAEIEALVKEYLELTVTQQDLDEKNAYLKAVSAQERYQDIVSKRTEVLRDAQKSAAETLLDTGISEQMAEDILMRAAGIKRIDARMLVHFVKRRKEKERLGEPMVPVLHDGTKSKLQIIHQLASAQTLLEMGRCDAEVIAFLMEQKSLSREHAENTVQYVKDNPFYDEW